jgi:hypothetical protein
LNAFGDKQLADLTIAVKFNLKHQGDSHDNVSHHRGGGADRRNQSASVRNPV